MCQNQTKMEKRKYLFVMIVLRHGMSRCGIQNIEGKQKMKTKQIKVVQLKTINPLWYKGEFLVFDGEDLLEEYVMERTVYENNPP